MDPLVISKSIISQPGSLMDPWYSPNSAGGLRKLGNLKWTTARSGTQNFIMSLNSSNHLIR